MPFTVTMPKLSPTMSEGVVAKWHKHPGDRVEAGDLLLEISTDKATVEHNALDEGFLRKIICKEGDKAAVNDPLAIFTASQDESIEGYSPAPVTAAPEKKEVVPQAPVKKVEAPTTRVLASPLARKLAAQKNLDLSSIQGSGPSGRVMSRDLAQVKAASPSEITEEAMTPMRKVIAQRLQEAKATIPHFYVRQDVDAQALWDMRESLKKHDLSYTINDFIIKACAHALKKHPEVNSGYNETNGTIIRFPRVDIAVAVTISGGLITPILVDAANKSLGQLSKEIKSLATRAREGKLSPQEYQGGSFTLSNLGMFGVTEMTAIINPPQGAILGVGAVVDAPVVRDGLLAVGKKLVITLSCDHRIIDGAEAASFTRTLKQLLENPLLFLTE